MDYDPDEVMVLTWNINLRVILENAQDNGHAVTHQQLEQIMSKLSEYLDKQTAFNTQQTTGLSSVAESVTDLSGDIETLNEKITELQNSPDRVTEEDQVRIDGLEAEGAALAEKAAAVSAALTTLAAKTPPKPPVEEPPTGEPTPESRRR